MGLGYFIKNAGGGGGGGGGGGSGNFIKKAGGGGGLAPPAPPPPPPLMTAGRPKYDAQSGPFQPCTSGSKCPQTFLISN